MVERNVTVTSKSGIHARPVALLAARVKDYTGTAEVLWKTEKANIKDMLELFAMAIPADAALIIRVSGPEEEQVADDLAAIIAEMED